MVSSNGMAIRRALPCILFLACCWPCVYCEAAAAAQDALVPALYVLGDSQADNGNNNRLLTVLRADFPHNGVDYDRGATGRFSNGKNFVDFLAEYLKLASAPPPYMSIRNNPSNKAIYLSGVNFASGGAGVSSETNEGQCISFDHQIDEHYSVVRKSLVNQLGENQASTHLAKSIFTVAIGGNDIIHYARATPLERFLRYLRYRQSPEQFIASLAQSLEGQLERMYNLGMRKLFIVGAAPLGCCPVLRKETPTKGCKGCHTEANYLSAQYNIEVAARLRDMRARHPDMLYSFFDGSSALLQYIQRPKENGYAVVDAACCGLGSKNAMFSCTPLSSLCENRKNHLFWDFVHPTEITAQKLMALAFNGSWPLATPINVGQLVRAT